MPRPKPDRPLSPDEAFDLEGRVNLDMDPLEAMKLLLNTDPHETAQGDESEPE